MGPYNETVQKHRADSIRYLLDANPQLDDWMRAVWEKKLNELSLNEDEYLARVKQVYSKMQPINRGWITYE